MSTITAESFRFMAELYKNNNRQWFDANRQRYERHVFRPLKSIAESLTGPVASILPEFSGRPRVSRINNDIRFHPNKPPYKEHMWISFKSGKENNAEIFAGVGRRGWFAGCHIEAGSREPLDDWRRNLLDNADIWRRYATAADLGEKVMMDIENPYKKPLFPDMPEDLRELVQARGVWLVYEPGKKIDETAEECFFCGICRILPLYLFMTIPPVHLLERITELGAKINPPNEEVGAMWKALQ